METLLRVLSEDEKTEVHDDLDGRQRMKSIQSLSAKGSKFSRV
jgi:hypothetical protein